MRALAQRREVRIIGDDDSGTPQRAQVNSNQKLEVAFSVSADDTDINNHDLISSDFTIAETNVSGLAELVLAIESIDTNTFTVTVDWTDGSGNVLYSESPVELTDATDITALFVVKSNHFQLTVTDTSGATQNRIDGTVNVH